MIATTATERTTPTYRIFHDAKMRLFTVARPYLPSDTETPARTEVRDRTWTARACLITAARDLGMSTREPV